MAPDATSPSRRSSVRGDDVRSSSGDEGLNEGQDEEKLEQESADDSDDQETLWFKVQQLEAQREVARKTNKLIEMKLRLRKKKRANQQREANRGLTSW